MARVTFITPDGDHRSLEVRVGQILMQGAIRQGVPGILAECGGSCECATCHVYVEGQQAAFLPPVSEGEDKMLEHVNGPRQPNSRLSCQIKMTADLDGLVVRIADNGV